MSSLGRLRVRWWLAGLLLLLGWFALPQRVTAHAFLQRTLPVAGTVVPASVSEVRLVFSEPVDVRADKVSVVSSAGQRVDRRDAHVAADDPLAVVVSLPTLNAGVYTVRYALVSSDTHPITGSFAFGVDVTPGALQTGAAPSQQVELTPVLWLQALGRGLILLGLSALLGPLVFRLCFVRSPWARLQVPLAEQAATYEPRAVQLITGAVGQLVLGQLLLLLSASLASALDSPWSALQPGNLLGNLTGRFGIIWLSRLGLLLIPALALPLISADHALREAAQESPLHKRSEQNWWLILLAGVAYALLTSIGGHAATSAPVLLAIFVDWLHLLSATIWLGLLMTLLLVGRGLVLPLVTTAPAQLSAVLQRFSTLALVCIQVLVVTGLYQAWVYVDSPAGLTKGIYGETLAVKLLVILPLLGLAALNRFVLLPRLQHAASAGKRFWQAVGAEVLVGTAVLLLAALLSSLPPARNPVQAAGTEATAVGTTLAESVTLSGAAGSTLVDLTIGPTTTGPAVLSVVLRDPTGATIPDARVTLRLTAANVGIPREITLTAANGRYSTLGDLTQPGQWRIEAIVTPGGGTPAQTAFTLTLPTGGARALLAQADQAMNKLTSLSERQSLSGGGAPIITVYQWAAPDRMRLRSDAGNESVIVGKRRYDLLNGRWLASDWPEAAGYRWPLFDYARTATEVTLLGQEKLNEVPCWVVTFLDTPSSTRLTFWIGVQDNLVRQQKMYGVGHYMVSVFGDFNTPVTIEPPQ